jgi:hypothetical protein
VYEKCKLFPITGDKVVCILDVAGTPAIVATNLWFSSVLGRCVKLLQIMSLPRPFESITIILLLGPV